MQAQERELIAGLFDRLRPFESQPRDPEAEALIRESVARQPASPYLLVQTVLVQEQALKAAQERIAELEAEGRAPSAPSGLPRQRAARSDRGAAPAQPAAACVRAVSHARDALAAAGGAVAAAWRGGGFLRSALATAAGVAGGALLFEGIRNMMGSNARARSVRRWPEPSPLLPPDTLPRTRWPAGRVRRRRSLPGRPAGATTTTPRRPTIRISADRTTTART